MNRSVQKLGILFSCITCVIVVSVGVWFYWQWNQTQTLYMCPQEEQTKPLDGGTPEQEDGQQVDTQQEQDEVWEPEPSVSTLAPVEKESVQMDGALDQTQAIAQREQEATEALYGYQATFLSALNGLYDQAKEDFFALPQDEQTTENRDNIAMGYALEAAILETECDRLVAQVLANLSQDLERLGGDTAIVSTMREAYIQKKTEEKNHFMRLLT